MGDTYWKVVLFRCLCALIMCATFFAIMTPAAIVQTYLEGTTCEGSIEQSNEQPWTPNHPANVTNRDERNYLSVTLFAFIAGGVILASVSKATEKEHAAATAVLAGAHFVLSTIQISSMLRSAREARPLDVDTIGEILNAPTMDGSFCKTAVLPGSKGINAEIWTCSLASVLRGEGHQLVQRACNSSIASRWIAMISCFAALLCTLTAVWYFARLLYARLAPGFGYKKAPSEPAENEAVEMS